MQHGYVAVLCELIRESLFQDTVEKGCGGALEEGPAGMKKGETVLFSKKSDNAAIGRLRSDGGHISAAVKRVLQISCVTLAAFSVIARGYCLGPDVFAKTGFLIPRKMKKKDAEKINVSNKLFFIAFSDRAGWSLFPVDAHACLQTNRLQMLKKI